MFQANSKGRRDEIIEFCAAQSPDFAVGFSKFASKFALNVEWDEENSILNHGVWLVTSIIITKDLPVTPDRKIIIPLSANHAPVGNELMATKTRFLFSSLAQFVCKEHLWNILKFKPQQTGKHGISSNIVNWNKNSGNFQVSKLTYGSQTGWLCSS